MARWVLRVVCLWGGEWAERDPEECVGCFEGAKLSRSLFPEPKVKV